MWLWHIHVCPLYKPAWSLLLTRGLAMNGSGSGISVLHWLSESLQASLAIALTLWQCLHRWPSRQSQQVHLMRCLHRNVHSEVVHWGTQVVSAGQWVVSTVTTYVLVPSEDLTVYCPPCSWVIVCSSIKGLWLYTAYYTHSTVNVYLHISAVNLQSILVPIPFDFHRGIPWRFHYLKILFMQFYYWNSGMCACI